MSETNQDSSSKAPNMLLQALMPTLLPNPKPEKPGKFDGTEFKWWQQKMLFYLTTLARFLQEDPPEPETDAWTQCDFLCRNYILNGLDDSLYNVYYPTQRQRSYGPVLTRSTRLRMLVPRSSS